MKKIKLPNKELLRDDFWYPCRNCGKGKYLIRGLCSDCAPSLHDTHNKQLNDYSKAAAEFSVETGKKPLAAWYEFEQWCGKKTKETP